MPLHESLIARLALGVVAVAVVGGCRSVTPAPQIPPEELDAAVRALAGPPAASAAALYRLQVPKASGLRASFQISSDGGRMSISDSFGRAVLLAGWARSGLSVLYDLDAGCRVPGADLASMIGAGRLPVEQAVRLLSGRLPAIAGDRVELRTNALAISGVDWSAEVVVAPDPWRVVEVRADTGEASAWRIELGDHSGSVPKSVHVERADGQWARLELVRRQIIGPGPLPELPDLPVCTAEDRR